MTIFTVTVETDPVIHPLVAILEDYSKDADKNVSREDTGERCCEILCVLEGSHNAVVCIHVL